MKIIYYFFSIFVIINLIGCSSLQQPFPATQQEKRQLLQKRFTEYWQARMQGDYRKSWQYELPSQRFLTSFERYKAMASGYKGMKVEFGKILYISPDEAIIERRIKTSQKSVVVKKDKWFFVKDNWYHKFYQSVFPPKTDEEAEFQ